MGGPGLAAEARSTAVPSWERHSASRSPLRAGRQGVFGSAAALTSSVRSSLFHGAVLIVLEIGTCLGRGGVGVNWSHWPASSVFSGKSFFPCVSLADLTDPQGRACETCALCSFGGPGLGS